MWLLQRKTREKHWQIFYTIFPKQFFIVFLIFLEAHVILKFLKFIRFVKDFTFSQITCYSEMNLKYSQIENRNSLLHKASVQASSQVILRENETQRAAGMWSRSFNNKRLRHSLCFLQKNNSQNVEFYFDKCITDTILNLKFNLENILDG